MKVRSARSAAALAAVLVAFAVLISSCQPFQIGNVRDLETAKKAALETLEKRYGVPFEFAEEWEGEPLDMETYMHWMTNSDFYKRRVYGQKLSPQRYGWQNGLFPIRVMNGLVRPVGVDDSDGYHFYEVSVYRGSVSDGAFGYIFEDEIKRRIMEVWKRRPANFPFLDDIRIEVRTADVEIPENVRSMSLEEFCPIAYADDRFAIRVWIYLYLPKDGYWGNVQGKFVTSFRPYKEQYGGRRYRFSGEELRTPNERLEKEMKVLEESAKEFAHMLRDEPSLKCLYEQKAFVLLGRLNDNYLGTHNVVGSDVFECVCDRINTANTRYSGGIGYWEMEEAVSEATFVNFASSESVLWHRPEETDEDNGIFDMRVSGNWNGRLGITWFKRKRKPQPPSEKDGDGMWGWEGRKVAESEKPAKTAKGARPAEAGGKAAESSETAEGGKSAEIAEGGRVELYDDGIDTSRIIEREDHSDWVCLDGSAADWVLFLQCHRPTTGFVEFDNGHWDRDRWGDYSRLKTILVTNRANGMQKTVTLRDEYEMQKIDLRDITVPGIVSNVYELRVLDVYRGGAHEAAAVHGFRVDVAEVPR